MRRPSVVLSFLVLLGSLLSGEGAVAQGATPETASESWLDLAAMALAPEDLPSGFFDDYAEWFVSPSAFSELVLGGEPVPTDLEQVYQSFYFSDAEQVAVHNYLFTFTTPEAAAANIGIVDATVLRPPLPEGTVDGPTTVSGPALGDESSTITRVTYDTRDADGPLVDVVASTFGRDRLIAGVSIERWTDPAAEGSSASPVADASHTDADLAMALATRLDDRVTTVLSGGTPVGVDSALSAMVLPVDQLAVAGTPVIGGYKPGIDLLRCGICGEENSLLPFADEALGGVSRTILVGPLVDGEPTPPFVSLAIIPFTGPDIALEVLEAMRLAPNDRPTPGPVPRGERILIADPAIPGATATLGFEGVLDSEATDVAPDSASVSFVMESWLVTVDVQGGLPAETALAVAVDLATQQSACLAAGGSCENLTVPDGLLADPGATPAASPEVGESVSEAASWAPGITVIGLLCPADVAGLDLDVDLTGDCTQPASGITFRILVDDELAGTYVTDANGAFAIPAELGAGQYVFRHQPAPDQLEVKTVCSSVYEHGATATGKGRAVGADQMRTIYLTYDGASSITCTFYFVMDSID
jgi:hypothetical protein